MTRTRPASFGRIVAALTLHELRLAIRRGESLLATFVIPVAVLLFFARVDLIRYGPEGVDSVDQGTAAVRALLPGAIALAIIASSLVALGIATGYDRAYGVLKRLGGSPASRGAVVASKIAATLVVESIQVVLLILVAKGLLGWTALVAPNELLLAIAVTLGTAAFAGLGLLLAGTLRAEATLALTNGLFLGAMLFGGILVPVTALPGPLAAIAAALPAAALTDALRIALGSDLGDPIRPLIALAGWAVVFVAAATWRFRWD